MRLSDAQLDQYDRDGFLVASRLGERETAALIEAFERDCMTTDGPHLVAEEETGVVRAMYAPHRRQPEYASLVRDAVVLDPARQLLMTQDVYVYQCKVNSKTPFSG